MLIFLPIIIILLQLVGDLMSGRLPIATARVEPPLPGRRHGDLQSAVVLRGAANDVAGGRQGRRQALMWITNPAI